MPRVKLILEYDLGDDWPDDYPLSANPEDWEQYFGQADVLPCDMDIIEVKIDEKD